MIKATGRTEKRNKGGTIKAEKFKYHGGRLKYLKVNRYNRSANKVNEKKM